MELHRGVLASPTNLETIHGGGRYSAERALKVVAADREQRGLIFRAWVSYLAQDKSGIFTYELSRECAQRRRGSFHDNITQSDPRGILRSDTRTRRRFSGKFCISVGGWTSLYDPVIFTKHLSVALTQSTQTARSSTRFY
jgi:hypothetical protein